MENSNPISATDDSAKRLMMDALNGENTGGNSGGNNGGGGGTLVDDPDGD